ncbi:Longitudinals lacking protein, isoforms A/B/D/L [Frankliniella fusca]|uniref:Longitudinals lacking protein, isoforms A/B/D/L n=1 Tax=Frankliniella fusca TaxID=407009 RepID=A0AAE1H5Z3_9NEOP|nr:Longitudinals lacking protein, isoforms A/B/D/L [Frankliniella fusca]
MRTAFFFQWSVSQAQGPRVRRRSAEPGSGSEPHAHPCPNPNCGAVYSLRRNLQRHLRLECGQEPRFKCPVCGFRSKRRNNLHNHMLVRHPDAPLPAM